LVLAAALGVGACSEPLVVTIAISPGNVLLDAFGATQQLSTGLTDQKGRPVTAVTVSWESDAGGIATVSSSGLVTAVSNGVAQVTASAGGSTQSVQVTVQQEATMLTKTGGDGQTGEVGQPLALPVEVRVDDRLGNPIAGTAVTFSVPSGSGSSGSASATTGTDGKAATTWTLGQAAGSGHVLIAGGAGQAVNFFATAAAGPGDSLGKVSGDGQVGLVSAPLPESLTVRVLDQFGNPVNGHSVSFSANDGGSVSPATATTGSNGTARTQWTLGSGTGAQTAAATATGVTHGSPATFTAAASTGLMSLHQGDGQSGLVGFGPNVRPAVRVVTAGNAPLAGAVVTFTVTGGGGNVTGDVQTTDADGIARVGRWQLGPAPGTNTLQATATGGVAGGPIDFSATGVGGAFDIELRNLSTLTASQQEAFDSAAAMWERLAYTDLPAVALSAAAGTCGSTSPAVNETIDDLVIFVTVEVIDGPGAVLASAGPCYIRGGSSLPILGRMRFDSEDLTNLETTGRMLDVVLHEMGHVLGIGSLWDNLGFLIDPSLPDPPGEDTHFDGARAITAFDELGGTSYTGGAKVPVENTLGGQGTRDVHWRESVFEHELMTGFVEAEGIANPLSRLSVASLWDLGYVVNLDGADAYTHAFLAPPQAARAGTGDLWLGDDVERGPVFVVSPRGAVTRVIRP
jgi:hypothetical protein